MGGNLLCLIKFRSIMRTRKKESPDDISPQRIHELEKTVESLGEKISHIDSLEDSISEVADRLFVHKEILTTSEACMYLGISESYLYKLTSAKKIPHYKPNGRLVFFNREELKQWAMRNPAMSKNLDVDNQNLAAL